jgi:glycosyltransferase involved in cell wall biosynthesis
MRLILMIDVRWYNACADFAIKQACGLMRLGHDVLLMTNPGSPPAVKAREEGLDVCEAVDFSGVGQFLRAPRFLAKMAREFKADILFAHRGESHAAAAIASRKLSCRIARFRGDVRAPRGHIFNHWLNERRTHGIAVSSEILRSEYEGKFRLNGVPMKVLYPAIDSQRFLFAESKSGLKAKYGLRANSIVVGIVGRLSPVKGHRYFIEAARMVSLICPNTEFVIAGDDAQIKRQDLMRSAAILGVRDMHFFGHVDNVAELMSAFDIGVIASIGSEMIGRVLLEYSAAGLPVVATSINQLSELLLQSRGGILVSPADAVAMGKAIIELIGDPARRNAFASSSKNWAFTRSLEALGRETEEFLTEVLNV